MFVCFLLHIFIFVIYKKNHVKQLITLLIMVFCILHNASANTNWTASRSTNQVFIENKGQFDIRHPDLQGKGIQYAIDGGSTMVYFTPSGVTYHLNNYEKNKDRKKGDHTKPRLVVEHEIIRVEWVNANPNVQIIAEEKQAAYHTYSYYTNNKKEAPALHNIQSFKKITYKNLYTNIDVEYTIHPNGGFKYSLILHPGADVSKVSMRYPNGRTLSVDTDGMLHIATAFGDIIEHAPVTFYAGNTSSKIVSSFTATNNTVKFNLGNYDKTKKVVLDPWVQTPAFATQWDCVWECDKDAAGNVYVIGGVMPLQLIKYNAAGALQWTFNTPYDTSNTWLGTLAVDNAGNSYVTEGTGGGIVKVNTAGTQLYNNTNAVSGLSTEFWSISFNCDQTKLVIGGTGGTLPPIPFIYDVNLNTGNVTSSLQVTSGALIPTQEVRSIVASGNGKYYYLTHDTIGYINQNFSICATPSAAIYKTPNSYSLGYKCENFRVDNTGIRALRTYGAFAFTHRGNQLDKRNFTTGAIVATVTIPGGGYTTGFGGNSVQNSGIDIDDCGNIYVGSKNQIIKYDQNLAQLAVLPLTVPTGVTVSVYDVRVSTAGDIIACGSTGTSSGSGARQGYVFSLNAAACAIVPIICCDASICKPANLCVTASPITLVASTPGGTWSGPGMNPTTGQFNPATAGAGTHTIIYTLACGSDSTTITVSPCAALSVCSETNGQFTVSNGVAPYSWQSQTTTQNCSACFFGCTIPPGCATNQLTWTTYATGTTVNPPTAAYPIRVLDASGTSLIINSAAQVLPCAPCPTITITSTATQNVTCPSTNNGFATVNATGGQTPYTYTWSNSATGATASNLSAGSYTVTARDANNCSATFSVTITAPSSPTVTVSNQVNPTCGLSNGSVSVTLAGGTAPYNVTITNGVNAPITQTVPIAGTAPVTNLPSGSYTVTVAAANGCQATQTFTLTASNAPTINNITVTAELCSGANDGTLNAATVTGGTPNYTWSYAPSATPGNTTAIPTFPVNNLAPGNYILAVTDASSCSATATFTIVAGPNCCTLSAASTVTQPTCAQSNGAINVTPTPAGTYTYLWSDGNTNEDRTGLAAGAYSITITQSVSCTFALTVNLNSNSTLVVSATNPINPTCANGDGSLTVGVSGGTAPYQVTIDTGGTPFTLTLPFAISQTLTNLSAGTVSVSVTDDQGCIATNSATLSLPTNCCTFIVSAALTQPSCTQTNGAIQLTTTNGSGNYTYIWGDGQTADNISGVGAGIYAVTITDVAYPNCFIDTSFALNSNSTLAIILTNPVNPTCAGDDGAITVTLSGGTAPYQVTVDTGGIPFTITVPIAITQTLTNLNAATVSVAVTDAQGCQASATATLTAPTSCCNLQTSAAAVDGSCGQNNAVITVTITTAGTAPYSYSLNGGTGQSSNVFNNLASGTYTIVTTDANGCTATSAATVQPSSNNLTLSLVATDITCFGANDGTITATPNGGTSPITYTWTGALSGATISGLSAGTYNVTATDNSGCSGTGSASIIEPADLVINLGQDANECEGVLVTLTAPSSFVSYNWSSGEQTQSITPTTTNLYTVTVTNSTGCTAADAVSVTFVPVPTIDLGSDVVTYEGLTVPLTPVVTPSNATGTYTWFPDSLLTCSACPNPVATAIDTITYVLTFANELGCAVSDTITINVQPVGNVFFPNAFTPNGDGRNDVFAALGANVKTYELRIYNRWGEKVFETNNFLEGWNGDFKGSAQPVAVYVYYASVTLMNNITQKFKGSLTLIR